MEKVIGWALIVLFPIACLTAAAGDVWWGWLYAIVCLITGITLVRSARNS